jgi:hypothetical protein
MVADSSGTKRGTISDDGHRQAERGLIDYELGQDCERKQKDPD